MTKISAPQAAGLSEKHQRVSRRTSYRNALLDPKNGPLVGIPTFVPLKTQRQRIRAIGTVSTTNGSLTVNLNPRCLGVSNGGAVKWVSLDGASDGNWNVANQILSNAEHITGDFTGYGSDLKCRTVAASITVTNTSSLNNRNGVFYGLQERHHHNLADMTASLAGNDASCKIAPGDKSMTLLYRPVQPREVEDWQHDGVKYPDEVTNTGSDGGPLDVSPGFMGIWWKGESGQQTFFVEVNAIVEYAGETKDNVASDPHAGTPSPMIPAEPKDIPHIVAEAELVEKHDAMETDSMAGFNSPAPSVVVHNNYAVEPVQKKRKVAASESSEKTKKTAMEQKRESPGFLMRKKQQIVGHKGFRGRYDKSRGGSLGRLGKDITTAFKYGAEIFE